MEKPKDFRDYHVNLYTIRDRMADETGNLFEAVNDAVAIRQYKHLLNQNPHAKSEDYQLLKLGSYNNKRISLVACGAPVDITPELVSADGQHPCEV